MNREEVLSRSEEMVDWFLKLVSIGIHTEEYQEKLNKAKTIRSEYLNYLKENLK